MMPRRDTRWSGREFTLIKRAKAPYAVVRLSDLSCFLTVSAIKRIVLSTLIEPSFNKICDGVAGGASVLQSLVRRSGGFVDRAVPKPTARTSVHLTRAIIRALQHVSRNNPQVLNKWRAVVRLS